MSFIGDILGGGSGKSDFQAQKAPITPTATKQQIDEQYGNATGALKQTQDMNTVLQQQNGVNNLNNAYGMVQNTANGMGPNPALMQLQQQTAANTANQAALMAGQRGVGANAGLLARQAAMQGASNQQNMNGQAATLQAQQQLAAQGQLAGIAQQQVSNQMQGNALANQNAQGLYGQVTGNMNNFNNSQISNVSQANSANAAIAAQNAQTQQAGLGGLMGGVGTILNSPTLGQNLGNAGKWIGNLFTSNGGAGTLGTLAGSAITAGGPMAGAAEGAGTAGAVMVAAHGGEVPSFGAKSKVGMHLKGAKAMKSGGQVPGKAPVAGNSYKNDNTPAILSPGEVVIPRSVMNAKNPAQEAAKFVQAILAKKGMKAPNAR